MSKLEDHCKQQLRALAKADQQRELKETSRDGTMVTQNGKSYVSFSCNDYLGLSQHPEVIEAAREATEKYGAGAGASRLVTGNHPLYAKLEARLAKMKNTEAALVFGSGYLANLGMIPALVGRDDLVLADKLIHACMLDGALLTGASFKRFRHNDPAHLEALLVEHRAQYQNVIILAEHVYSMDGDIAPLGRYSHLAKDHDAWLMVDDAHGFGLLAHDKKFPVDIWMGTLSKAVGGYGGYIAAKKSVIDLLATRARSMLFSTGLPPATCATAHAALEIIDEEPERRERPLMLAAKVCDAMKMQRTNSAIVPIVLGEAKDALEASESLKKRGILAVAIRPPTVPAGTARLRLTFSAAHTDAQVDQLIAALIAEKIRPIPCPV